MALPRWTAPSKPTTPTTPTTPHRGGQPLLQAPPLKALAMGDFHDAGLLSLFSKMNKVTTLLYLGNLKNCQV